MKDHIQPTCNVQPLKPSCRFKLPTTMPRLVVGTQGTFLVYGGPLGLRIPATPELIDRHLRSFKQHLEAIRHG